MWNFDYDKVDCYLYTDNQPGCIAQNAIKRFIGNTKNEHSASRYRRQSNQCME
jgi:hypothetical protein